MLTLQHLPFCSTFMLIFLLLKSNFSTQDNNISAHKCIQLKTFCKFSTIIEYIDYLVEKYPNYVSSEVIGISWEGRELRAVRITNGDLETVKPIIFVEAGLHGHEWVAPASAINLMAELAENPKNKYILKYVDFYILAIANPDGYEYSHSNQRFWSKNRSNGTRCVCLVDHMDAEGKCGVDLNRNFPIKFKIGINHCLNDFGGIFAFSEPETIAIRNVVLRLQKRILMYISLGAFCPCIKFPTSSYNVEGPTELSAVNSTAYAIMRAIFRVNGHKYDVITTQDIYSYGTSVEYVKSLGVKFVYSLDLPAKGFRINRKSLAGYEFKEEDLQALGKETFKGFLEAARKATIYIIENIEAEELARARYLGIADLTTKSSVESCLRYRSYCHYETLVNFFSDLQIDHKEYVEVVDIADTWEHRKVKLLKITNGDNTKIKKRIIWIDGGTSGREWPSIVMALHIIRQLVIFRAYFQDLLVPYDWYIVPLVNPDGYVYSYEKYRYWIKNRRPCKSKCNRHYESESDVSDSEDYQDITRTQKNCGVNLCRNFPNVHGNESRITDSCNERYGGPHPLSEFESSAIANFLSLNNDSIDFYFTLRTYGQSILYPWRNTYTEVEDIHDLQNLGEVMSSAMEKMYGTVYTVRQASYEKIEQYPGSSLDYAKSVGIKYVYAMNGPPEYKTEGHTNPYLFKSAELPKLAKEIFEGIHAAINEVKPTFIHLSFLQRIQQRQKEVEIRNKPSSGYKIEIYNLKYYWCLFLIYLF